MSSMSSNNGDNLFTVILDVIADSGIKTGFVFPRSKVYLAGWKRDVYQGYDVRSWCNEPVVYLSGPGHCRDMGADLPYPACPSSIGLRGLLLYYLDSIL
jgi:hypothetical protein